MTGVADYSDVQAEAVRRVARIRAVYAGTEAMRAAGRAYLPQWPAETAEAYAARLSSAYAPGYLRRIVDQFVGLAIRQPVSIADAAPEVLEWAEDIDLAGRDITAFAADVLAEAIVAGIAWIHVDAPPRLEGETAADARLLRPYLSLVPLEDVLGWRTEAGPGGIRLVQVRLREHDTEPAGEWGQRVVQRVRVLDSTDSGVLVRVFQRIETGRRAGQWEQIEERQTDAPEITVVPVYTARTGFWTARPPLLDAADLCVAHWQSLSDQRTILHVARVPILFGAGLATQERIEISASSAILTPDPSARLQYVEHSGAAIEAGRRDLADLEQQIAMHGVRLAAERVSPQSATGAAIEAARELSALQWWAANLADALEHCLALMGRYAGIDQTGVVSIDTEYQIAGASVQELDSLLRANQLGLISRATLINELRRRGVLSDAIDAEAEAEAAAAEALLAIPRA